MFTADVRLRADGTRYVVHADPVLLVWPELLAPGVCDDGVWEPHDGGGTLTLDTDGEYRYRMTRRRDPLNPGCYIFERIDGDPTASRTTPS